MLLIFSLSGLSSVFGRKKFCLFRKAGTHGMNISPEGFLSLGMRVKKNSSRFTKFLEVCASCTPVTSQN